MFGALSIRQYIKYYRRVTFFGTIATVSLFLISLAALIPLSPEPHYAEAATGTAKDSTITISNIVPASMNLAVNDINGTFTTTDTGPSGASTTNAGTRGSFSITTNNVSGYYLTISASDDTKTLINSDSSPSTSLSSISSNMTASTFNAAANNGLWGYKPSKYMTGTDASSVVDNTSTSTGVYLPAPTTTVTPLDKTTTSNPTTPNTYTIDLAARLQYAQSSGTYTKTFILTATGNPVTYSITFSDNTGDNTVANLPARQYNDDGTSSTSITLTSATPTRTGYTFSKWCLGTVSNNGTTCTGTQYSAGGSFGIDQTTSNSTTLYAVWTPNVYTLTLTNTNATTTGSTAARVTYNSSTVYGDTSGTSGITNPQRSYNFTTFSNAYNNATDAIVSSTANKTYTYGFDGWYTASSGGTRVITSAGALVASTSYTNSSSAWTSTSSPTLYAHWNYGSVTLPTITKEGYNCGWGTSTNTTTKTYGSGDTVTSTNAPTTNTALYGVCSIKNNLSFKVTFDSGVTSVAIKSGSSTGTTVGTVSTSGSSVSGLTYNAAYYLVPTYASGKKLNTWSKDANTVGTLSSTSAENPTYTIGDGTNAVTLTSQDDYTGYYIQDFTKSLCQSNASSANYTVRDKRDNKDYTVRYINGACWMTSNLRFTGTTLSSATSNVDTTYTDASPYKINQNMGTSYSWKSLKDDSVCKDGTTHTTNNTSYQCMQEGNDNNGNPTVWYNYAGATAGTITGTSNSTTASYDICPKGWHLPAYGSSTSEAGSIRSVTSYSSAFSPVYGGYYNNGSLINASTNGDWWSATAYNNTSRCRLYYYNGSLNTSNNGRRFGSYVRCIRADT